MKTYYISKPDETMRQIVSATFPDYNGKKFHLSTCIPSRLDSYWSGGSRDYFAFYHLDEHKSFSVHSNHPAFESGQPRNLESLPERILLVMRSYFCGKDSGITIYANECDLAKMLPAPSDITDHERIVLKYTSALKNTYAGQKHVRFKEANRETGISRDQWIEAQITGITKGLLRKNRSITPDGRNAIS
ncbi:MAG: hypothetical protein GY774_35615 [Planctomycetes bacterium]|nr:hypothetical protein [Planctomycetota bacterium]